MTTALAKKEETALAEYGALGVEGLEHLDPSDLIIPRLKIVQPTSAEATADVNPVKPGVFVSNLTGETFETITIVPLIIKKSRAMFVEGEDKPACKSNDAILPSNLIEVPQNDRCAAIIGGRMQVICGKAMWIDNEPPACQLAYNVMALNLVDDSPFFVTLKGTSARSAKKLISHLASKRISPFNMSCQMSLAKTKNAKGTFFVVDFTAFKPVDPAGKYYEQFASIKDYDVQRTYDAEEEMGIGKDGVVRDEEGKELF